MFAVRNDKAIYDILKQLAVRDGTDLQTGNKRNIK